MNDVVYIITGLEGDSTWIDSVWTDKELAKERYRYLIEHEQNEYIEFSADKVPVNKVLGMFGVKPMEL